MTALMSRKSSPHKIPYPARLCVLYNRLFGFRAKQDWLIRETVDAARRRQADAVQENLRYAAMEYRKASVFFQKFPKVSLTGKRVLDFGCRYGGSTLWYAQQGAAHVIGIDILEEILAIARMLIAKPPEPLTAGGFQSVAGIEFKAGSATHIPVDDGSIDVILSEDVIEHLQNPEQMFSEWERILAPGGQVLISFGPLWYHPHGIHLWEVFHAPWTHVFFSQTTCLWAKSILKGEEPVPQEWALHQEELTQRFFQLNRMTLTRFHNLVAKSKLKPRMKKVHATWRLGFLLRVPWLREFVASQVDCVLEK